MRYAPTGVCLPLTSAGSRRSASGACESAAKVGSLEHRLTALGPLLQPLGKVHRVTDNGVLEPLVRAEQRRGDIAGGDTDAEMEGGQTGRLPARIQPAWRLCIAFAAATARSHWSG